MGDGDRRGEGCATIRSLTQAGLKCTFAQLHSVSYVMGEVSKVLLNASSMLLNGTLVGRAGSALVAMAAHRLGVPVIVCCATFKFTERVLLDSICYNELGDPDELVEKSAPQRQGTRQLADWRDIPQLRLLNLRYDVTPTKFLTMVVTEAGVIPPTSVPVIIREAALRDAMQTPAAPKVAE